MNPDLPWNGWLVRPTQPPAIELLPTPVREGCTAEDCTSQRTVLLHPQHGRQCPDHATLPPGGFRRELAEDMVAMGRADAAFRYLAAWLVAEAARRFEVTA